MKNTSHTSLKIAMITDNYHPKIGGVEYCVDALGRYLVKRGHEVTIITRKARHQPIEEQKGVLQIKRVSYFTMLGVLLGISRQRSKFFDTFDIIHAHSLGSPLAIFALLIAKKINKPHVLTSHSLYRDLDKWLMKYLGKLIHHTICVSNAVVADIQSINSKSITHYIPNGFDVTDTKKTNSFVDISKKPGEILIGTVSRLSSKKNVSDFIKAADFLVKKHNHLKFIIIGDGPQRKRLQKKAAKCQLSKHVYFTGGLPRTAVFKVLEQMDIFVLTSPHEAFGMVILEAIYHHIPTVAFDNNGISDIITSGKTGYLAASLEEMINCIIKLIESPEQRSQFSNDAAPIINKFQWDNVAEKTESVYNTLSFKL